MTTRSTLPFFAAVTLVPLVLIGAAAAWGGLWVVLAVLFLTVLTASLDEIVARITPAQPDVPSVGAAVLSVILATGHFAVLAGSVVALARPDLMIWEKLLLFYTAGLFMGQVSNSNAHELIHSSSRNLHRLGMWVYVSMLFGHHTSAHVLVHHRYVATRQDPNSSRLGEGFYRYLYRAWTGSFRAGLHAESERLARAGRGFWRHPYLVYLGGGAGMMAIAYVLAGGAGIACYLLLCGLAQIQLMLSDYVQHYGLERAINEHGRPETVADYHSWNSPHWFSSALMLNAPRHSDHHAHPARGFIALSLPDHAPMLPRSLPVMACVALVPRVWRRVMDPRVAQWHKMNNDA